MKIRIQCINCDEKFKFVVEPGMKYDFICPHCNTEQSFETPGTAEAKTQEIPMIDASPDEELEIAGQEEEAPPSPAKPSLGLRPPPAPPAGIAPPGRAGDKYVPPPKKEVKLKKDGKDKAAAIMKWSFRLILLAVVAGIGWKVWKSFFDPGGKVAWRRDMRLEAFHLLENTNGGIRFLSGGKVMRLNAETGEVKTLAELPDYAKYPHMMAECGKDRALFASGEKGKFYGFAVGKDVAMVDFGGKKLWERSFTGRVSSVACGDEIMVVQTVESIYKETRGEYDVYDYIYRAKALRIDDGSEVWAKGPQTNKAIYYHTLAGGRMMINQGIEEGDGEDDDRSRLMVLTASELAADKPVWRIKTADRMDWGPFIHGDALIFKQKKKLTALKLESGDKLWELEVDGHPRQERHSRQDTVYFNGKKSIAAVDLKSGRKLWENSYGAEPEISHISDKYIFLGSVHEKIVERKESDDKLPPAYEQLKQEEPDLFGNALAEKGPKVKYEKGVVCIDAATGKQLWEVKKIHGQVVAKGNRIVLFWDSADTTFIGGMNRSGKTVIHQYAAKTGKQLFDRNDDVALSAPYLICGGKFIALTHDRAGGRESGVNGFVAFNLK